VANVTFNFGTSPNTKPEEKKWGDMAYYIPPPEKLVGTRPTCPPPNRAHANQYKCYKTEFWNKWRLPI